MIKYFKIYFYNLLFFLLALITIELFFGYWFDKDNFGGQLTIKAPNARLPNISPESPVEDRINYVIYNEINPMLESHGGEVYLVEFNDKGEAVLQFGGGCQGCGMVDVTLKDGIEKTLVEQIPEVTGVKDMTDHSIDDNAYY